MYADWTGRFISRTGKLMSRKVSAASGGALQSKSESGGGSVSESESGSESERESESYE